VRTVSTGLRWGKALKSPSLPHTPSRLQRTKLLTHVNNFSHHLKCQRRFAPTLFTSSERSIHVVGIRTRRKPANLVVTLPDGTEPL
jgi:hypothetical protein